MVQRRRKIVRDIGSHVLLLVRLGRHSELNAVVDCPFEVLCLEADRALLDQLIKVCLILASAPCLGYLGRR